MYIIHSFETFGAGQSLLSIASSPRCKLWVASYEPACDEFQTLWFTKIWSGQNRIQRLKVGMLYSNVIKFLLLQSLARVLWLKLSHYKQGSIINISHSKNILESSSVSPLTCKANVNINLNISYTCLQLTDLINTLLILKLSLRPVSLYVQCFLVHAN